MKNKVWFTFSTYTNKRMAKRMAKEIRAKSGEFGDRPHRARIRKVVSWEVRYEEVFE